MNVAAWRRDTRARLIDARQQVPADEQQRVNLRVESLLEAFFEKLSPQVVSAYWPFKSEIDLRGLMERLRARGWTTALPSVVGRRMPLEFLRWTSEADMEPGVYDIPIPRIRHVVQPTIVITPLVAFDLDNYRLGYGGGFFDITLAAMSPRPQSIGVGFELTRLETIYPAETDIPMDFIVTEAGIERRGALPNG